ncbi:dipeptide ABC transporter ATP-binding protein [Nocardia aurantia]|uniref:Putative ABC transporter ATP-binding protein n=1 Tax=Nocardia aurantia TaxID=2585199 RepID=A0A7K0DFV9_9NOCA|nr:ABC transporter ATP-binding protein [Nocardia aurantia]MQY24676.1 putative ABC transporter ATP-binding protein [Nocardia aurantia]
MAEVSAQLTDARPDPTLTVAALSVFFATDAGPVTAVDEVSFEVYPGEVLAIVGESGSGKSVCARTALGLLPGTARVRGTVLLGDRPVTTMSERQLTALRGGRIAMVFQEPGAALDPLFTVGFQIMEAIRAHGGATRSTARARAIELLRTVGLPDPEHRIDFYPHQLSGGQKQRVMIAIAIACEPQVIIADEPTTALDVTVQAEILELLRDLRDRIGAAIVLITHNMGVVADLADRVVVMRHGRVVETATVHDLFAAPRAQYTRDLLAAVPRMHTGAPESAATPHLPSAPPDATTGTGAVIDLYPPSPTAATVPSIRTGDPASTAAEQLSAEAAVLAVEDLVVEFPGSFGRRPFRAVDSVSLHLGRGETLGLVGESGSGKTTIGRCVAALQRPTAGTIRLLGTELTGLSERRLRPLRKRLGFVFQDPATSLNPRLTVGRCVAEPLIVHRAANGPALRTRVRQLLDAVQLPAGTENRYPHELSGGQRQRASLARALVLNPDLLIADEPTSALDVSVQATVLELFAQLQSEFGWACLFISHDLAVVDQVAERIMVLRNGSVVEQGSADAILRHPAEDYTRRLVAAVPVPDPVEQRRRRTAAAESASE